VSRPDKERVGAELNLILEEEVKMEVFGNIEALKEAIEKKYTSKIREVEKEKEKQLNEIDKELKKKLNLLDSRMKTASDAEVKKTHSVILSEEKLKAKKEFEEKREELINKVFKEAEKKSKKIVRSKEYIDYVKSNIPKEKDLKVTGSDALKKHFPKLKVDKNILGLKFESEGIIYDFTLDNMINSKKDVLRHEISKVLFS